MIIKMILCMDVKHIDVDRDVTIPNNDFICFIFASEVLLCLCLMSKMSDVFLYAVPMMLYCQYYLKEGLICQYTPVTQCKAFESLLGTGSVTQ